MKRQVKIGLVVLVSIILIYSIISWTRNSGFFDQDTNSYSIFFENVNGLKTNDPVTLYGYEVGRVKKIHPVDSGMKVTVSLKNDVILYSDATAKILLKEIMGSKLIDINPGNSKILLNGNQVIKGNPTFDFTIAMDKVGQLFSDIKPETIRKTIENLEQISTQLAKFTNDDQMNQLKTIVDKMSSSLTRVDHLLMDVEQRRLIAKLDKTFSDVTTLMQEVTQTLSQIQTLGNKAENLIPKIDGLLSQTDLALKNADTMISDVRSTLTELKQKKSVVGKLMYDSTYVNKLDSTLLEVNSTMQHFRNKAVNVRMRVFKMP